MFGRVQVDAVDIARNDDVGGIQEFGAIERGLVAVVAAQEPGFLFGALEHLGIFGQTRHGRRRQEQ